MDFNQACPRQGEFPLKPAFPPQDESYPQHELPYPQEGQPYPQEGQPYPQEGQPYLQQGQSYSQEGVPYPQQGQPCLPPSYDYQPQPSTSANTIVVTAQPATLITSMPPPKNQQPVAICALVLSIITLICCGPYLICLTCSIPALILAIIAMTSTGTKQTNTVGISITLNVIVIIFSVVSVIATSAIFVPVIAIASLHDRDRSNCYRYYCS